VLAASGIPEKTAQEWCHNLLKNAYEAVKAYLRRKLERIQTPWMPMPGKEKPVSLHTQALLVEEVASAILLAMPS